MRIIIFKHLIRWLSQLNFTLFILEIIFSVKIVWFFLKKGFLWKVSSKKIFGIFFSRIRKIDHNFFSGKNFSEKFIIFWSKSQIFKLIKYEPNINLYYKPIKIHILSFKTISVYSYFGRSECLWTMKDRKFKVYWAAPWSWLVY